MRVCGIIAEYDPFHKGHLYQLEQARQLSGADYVVAVISTAFTQRGLPALFSTHDRARMALQNGVDLVLGLPVSYSCAQANRFALGGVATLDALGPVSHLSFGVEQAAIPYLEQTVQLLRAPSPRFRRKLRLGLDAGKSFARAQGEALADSMPGIPLAVLRQPNFILALAYAQALQQLGSGIKMLPVPRLHAYHASSLEALPAASAVRAALLRGDWQGLQQGLPPPSYHIVAAAAMRGQLHPPEALDSLLMAKALAEADYSLIAEMSEGLDQRIQKLAPQARGREELAGLVKTKRYTHNRVMRALSGILLGLTQRPLEPPAYARLLGFRQEAQPLLKALGESGFPLISRPARQAAMAEDMGAEALWYLGAGQPAKSAYQQVMIIR